jgi:RNA polymerase sigma factor (sigma-70 family)
VGKFSDKEILAAIRDGDDNKVIPLLYKEILPNVNKYICNNSGSKDEAKDIFQEALILFYRQVIEGVFNESKYKVHGYIYTLSRNLWINECKKKNRMIRIDEHSDFEIIQEENILDLLMADERESEIKQVFSLIGDKCLEILSYSFFHKFSMRDIAEKMNFTSENAAKTAHYRCKHKLMEIIEGNEHFEKLIRHEV